VAANEAAAIPRVAGRAAEIDAVLTLARRAVRHQTGALLVSGEAGVGKTALLRHATALVADQVTVLWVRCLPFAALVTPLLPLRSALPGLPLGDGAEVLATFDAWLARGPTLVVVDDLQWADRATLDVLMYVLAGDPDRPLAVAGTRRSGEEEPLRRWLADARRLPGVHELALRRLDRPATAEQIAMTLGRLPHESLVDDVYARGAGNPYLTSLLVRDLEPDTTALPAGLPTELRDALCARWRDLSEAGRELTTMIAVAGRPQRSAELIRAGCRAPILPALHEAVDAGVLVTAPDERYWFAHPLVAEVLADQLLVEERRALHATFATVLGGDPVAAAEHYHRAGLAEPAYRWALTAADSAGPEAAIGLLRRALDLAPRLPARTAGSVDLLRRLRAAAAAAGRDLEELAAVTELLDRLDHRRRPLEAAELLVRRSRLGTTTGAVAAPDDARSAVRLAGTTPGTAEHALALAELARIELWHGEPSGTAHARESVTLAERLCTAAPLPAARSALAGALVSDVMARLLAGDFGCLDQALRAYDQAAAANDQWTMVHAALWATYAIDGLTTPESVQLLRHCRERAATMGAPHTYLARYSAVEARGLFMLGNWRGCLDRMRDALGASPGPFTDVTVRLTAAQLACRQGRPAEAGQHLIRAEEVFREHTDFPALPFDSVRAELAVAAGNTDQALSVVDHALASPVPPTQVERLLPLAARALADRVQAIRDRGGDPRADVERLTVLRRRYPRIITESGGGKSRYWALVTALQAWYDAEAARAAGTSTMVLWRRAAEACAAADTPWDEAYCRWRQAEIAATTATPDRSVLRHAHRLAVELRATPLIEAVEYLAHTTRTRVGPPPVPARPPDPTTIPGLTPREWEVLGHLASGRTYAEIAAALVISEKTVSTHVSNMLRKTGTANRVALAQLAERTRTR